MASKKREDDWRSVIKTAYEVILDQKARSAFDLTVADTLNIEGYYQVKFEGI